MENGKSKGNEASNYCLITCLPFTWKLLTRRISDKIYAFLENEGMLHKGEKGFKKKPKGSRDQ